MAKRFERRNNFFIVTDTVTSNIEINHPTKDVRFGQGSDTVFFTTIEGTKTVNSKTYKFNDVVGVNDDSFYNIQQR